MANSLVLAGRCSVRTREPIATARMERLMISASCDSEPNCDKVIGNSSVVKVKANPRRQIDSARNPIAQAASPFMTRASASVQAALMPTDRPSQMPIVGGHKTGDRIVRRFGKSRPGPVTTIRLRRPVAPARVSASLRDDTSCSHRDDP
jgi:hypothetical protein